MKCTTAILAMFFAISSINVSTAQTIANENIIGLQKKLEDLTNKVTINIDTLKKVNNKLAETKKYLFNSNKHVLAAENKISLIERCGVVNKIYNKKTNGCISPTLSLTGITEALECAEGEVITQKDDKLSCELPVNGCNCPYTDVSKFHTSWPATTTCGFSMEQKYKTAKTYYIKKGICTLSGWVVFTP